MGGGSGESQLLLCGHCKSIFRSGFSRCPADGHELAPLVDDPFVGQVFAGRYAIEALVGEGAMGRVYRARHTRMSKRFAVKIMFGDLASDATMRARFQSEAEAASRLDHPHVVSVVDFGDTVGGLVYMVMDFVEGVSLARLLEVAGGPLSEARARVLLRQIALGLQHAHDRGLVHRDLKTDNIVVVETEGHEVARIIDFGIAMFSDAAPGPAKLTAVGVVIGTPAYMSPEQACGEKIDHRSDLFSLGIVAYEMLAGKKPFDGHPFEMARQNIASTPPPLAVRTPGVRVDPQLEAMVFRLLAKSRDDRYPIAQAFVDALDGVLSPEFEPTLKLTAPVPAAALTPRRSDVDLSAERPLANPPPRSRAVVGLGLGLVLVAGGAGAAWWASSRGDVPPPPLAAAELTPAPLAPAPDPTPVPTAALDPLAARIEPTATPTAPGAVDTPGAPDTPGVVDPDEPAEEAAPAVRPRPRRLYERRPPRDDSAAGPIAKETLTLRLRQVSDQVNLLGKQRGARFAETYQARLRQVQALYVDALRDPSKRRLAYEELERLRAELARL